MDKRKAKIQAERDQPKEKKRHVILPNGVEFWASGSRKEKPLKKPPPPPPDDLDLLTDLEAKLRDSDLPTTPLGLLRYGLPNAWVNLTTILQTTLLFHFRKTGTDLKKEWISPIRAKLIRGKQRAVTNLGALFRGGYRSAVTFGLKIPKNMVQTEQEHTLDMLNMEDTKFMMLFWRKVVLHSSFDAWKALRWGQELGQEGQKGDRVGLRAPGELHRRQRRAERELPRGAHGPLQGDQQLGGQEQPPQGHS